MSFVVGALLDVNPMNLLVDQLSSEPAFRNTLKGQGQPLIGVSGRMRPISGDVRWD